MSYNTISLLNKNIKLESLQSKDNQNKKTHGGVQIESKKGD